ncbi:P-type conjugative transfer protein TrbL [Burkholderia cenocepacia]|uniref:P-type conjugative transfer protein TrbL n=1 Tax=Burkholderia cenocepacia TaxID=95486 RepID=UPI0013E00BFB|nr:P-type conjugative transfer protein TrbL [Burkholderia cenocepacia]MCW3587402.1 P-type conjugative transfer protein TrbL [Burkholderia cenocepacia]MCW3632606.1 P-type conjugative transfer protein TrbL [Burkholderia cenocepacia]MCW5181837.1 P-type conjugative transfer protein TrbL [Burkholderia cenocepacia]
MRKNLVAFGGAALLLPQLAYATADASGQMQVMQSLLDRFAQNGRAWMNATDSVALSVFGTLALIELALKMRKVVLSGGEEGPIRVIGVLINSILTWGFFLWAMKNPEFVLGNIVHGFEKLGGKASGMGTLNPSQMIGAGIDIAIQINNGVSSWTALTSPSVGFTASFTELAVIAGFAILGLQMFACLLHYYLLLACAPILLAGGALSFTRDWAVKQFQGSVATGVKIFVIYLIAGVVTSFVPDFKNALNTGGLDNIAPLLGMLAAGVLIMFLGFLAPSVASAIMGGTSSMSANEMAGFGASVGGAAAMGLGMAVGGGALAAGLMSKGVQGLGGLSNAAGALGNALGQMSSGGGVMKEALSTGGGLGGQGSSPIDTAKRVGGDMPSGLTPSTSESKALMNQPADDTRKAPATDSGAKGGEGSAEGSGKPSDGASGQNADTPASEQQGAVPQPSSGSSGSGGAAQQPVPQVPPAALSAVSSGAGGAPAAGTGAAPQQARAVAPGAAPTSGGSSAVSSSEALTNDARSAAHPSSSETGGTPASSGGEVGQAGPTPSATGAQGAGQAAAAADSGPKAPDGVHSQATAGPGAGERSTPTGDASNASISGNQNDRGPDPQKPSRTQKVRDMLDTTHRHFDSAKGFIPDAHNNGSLHINIQE